MHLFGCSVEIEGEEEGSGQMRLCLDCYQRQFDDKSIDTSLIDKSNVPEPLASSSIHNSISETTCDRGAPNLVPRVSDVSMPGRDSALRDALVRLKLLEKFIGHFLQCNIK